MALHTEITVLLSFPWVRTGTLSLDRIGNRQPAARAFRIGPKG